MQYIYNVKTIAITIEEPMLRSLDRLARRGKKRNRSELVRAALAMYLAREAKRVREERERKILHAHRRELERDALALIDDQAAS